MTKRKKTSKKPSLTLLSGEEALDTKSLIQMFIALTGREPTEAELQEALALQDASDEELDKILAS